MESGAGTRSAYLLHLFRWGGYWGGGASIVKVQSFEILKDCEKGLGPNTDPRPAIDSATEPSASLREYEPRGTMHEVKAQALIRRFPSQLAAADRANGNAERLG